jgi:Tfp pilus assembly protein PilW
MAIKRFQNFFNNRGFSLIEMLEYVSILSIIFLVIVNTSISFTGSYHTLSALRAADHAGIDALESITRAVRSAGSVTGTGAALSLSQTSSGVSTTTQFYLQGGTIDVAVRVNGVLNTTISGPLTASDASVTSLTFTQLATSTASAVKIDMTVQAASGPVLKSKVFHSTVILRG